MGKRDKKGVRSKFRTLKNIVVVVVFVAAAIGIYSVVVSAIDMIKGEPETVVEVAQSTPQSESQSQDAEIVEEVIEEPKEEINPKLVAWEETYEKLSDAVDETQALVDQAYEIGADEFYIDSAAVQSLEKARELLKVEPDDSWTDAELKASRNEMRNAKVDLDQQASQARGAIRMKEKGH